MAKGLVKIGIPSKKEGLEMAKGLVNNEHRLGKNGESWMNFKGYYKE